MRRLIYFFIFFLHLLYSFSQTNNTRLLYSQYLKNDELLNNARTISSENVDSIKTKLDILNQISNDISKNKQVYYEKAECFMRLGEEETAFGYLQQAIQDGFKIEQIPSNSQFSKHKIEVQTLYNKFRPLHLASVDTVLARKIKNLIANDQLYRGSEPMAFDTLSNGTIFPKRSWDAKTRDSMMQLQGKVDIDNLKAFQDLVRYHTWGEMQQATSEFIFLATMVNHIPKEKDALKLYPTMIKEAKQNKVTWNLVESVMETSLFKWSRICSDSLCYNVPEGTKLRFVSLNKQGTIYWEESLPQLKALVSMLNHSYVPRNMGISLYSTDAKALSALTEIKHYLIKEGIPEKFILIDNKIHKRLKENGIRGYVLGFNYVKI